MVAKIQVKQIAMYNICIVNHYLDQYQHNKNQ